MSNFANAFKANASMTTTENGGLAFKATGGGALLDLFAKIGGMRDRNIGDVISDWKRARSEEPTLADNLVLYSRDIRNAGLGERKIGRALLRELALIDGDKVARNLEKIVDVGRYDDLFVLLDTPIADAVYQFIWEQLQKDMNGAAQNAPISILAKWMPSINTSSAKTRALGFKFCKAYGLKKRTYRKALSKLRRYLNVVETLMSNGEWDKINFEAVPSVAMNRYIKTYNEKCGQRFAEYKAAVKAGTAKVNAGALYPYDIVNHYFNGGLDAMDEEQWKSLPNFVDGEYDVVVMADVSESMWGRPIESSIGLATYFAQRNKGAYHGMYMSFTDEPHFICLNDEWSLNDCINYAVKHGVGYNTNLDRAFEAIYDTAVRCGEAPRALVVISDGEFDHYATSGDSIAEKWNKKFRAAGFDPVKVISWNAECRNDNLMGRSTDNIAFVSGQGAGPFKNLLDLIENNAYDSMVKILSNPVFCWD